MSRFLHSRNVSPFFSLCFRILYVSRAEKKAFPNSRFVSLARWTHRSRSNREFFEWTEYCWTIETLYRTNVTKALIFIYRFKGIVNVFYEFDIDEIVVYRA